MKANSNSRERIVKMSSCFNSFVVPNIELQMNHYFEQYPKYENEQWLILDMGENITDQLAPWTLQIFVQKPKKLQ